MRPTDAGVTVLSYARRMIALNDEMLEALSGATVALTIRLGVPDDFAAGRTTHALAAFKRAHPQVKLEVTCGLSRDISAAYDRGGRSRADQAATRQPRGRRALAEKLRWIDSAKHPTIDLDPVPIVVFPPRALSRRHDQGDRGARPPLADQLHDVEPERHQAAVADGSASACCPRAW